MLIITKALNGKYDTDRNANGNKKDQIMYMYKLYLKTRPRP